MLGKDIKKIREDLNISQHELARRMEVSQTTIWSWENDYKRPTFKNEKKLKEIHENGHLFSKSNEF